MDEGFRGYCAHLQYHLLHPIHLSTQAPVAAAPAVPPTVTASVPNSFSGDSGDFEDLPCFEEGRCRCGRTGTEWH